MGGKSSFGQFGQSPFGGMQGRMTGQMQPGRPGRPGQGYGQMQGVPGQMQRAMTPQFQSKGDMPDPRLQNYQAVAQPMPVNNGYRDPRIETHPGMTQAAGMNVGPPSSPMQDPRLQGYQGQAQMPAQFLPWNRR